MKLHLDKMHIEKERGRGLVDIFTDKNGATTYILSEVTMEQTANYFQC